MATFSFFNFASASTAASSMYVSLENKTIIAGDTFTMDVMLSNVPTGGLAYGTVSVGFDKSKFTCTSIEKGPIVSTTLSRNTNTDNGCMAFTDYIEGDKTITQSGVFCKMTFKANTTCPAGKYSFKVLTNDTIRKTSFVKDDTFTNVLVNSQDSVVDVVLHHSGLKAEYFQNDINNAYRNLDAADLKVTKTEKKIDFTWDSVKLESPLDDDKPFSVRLSGYIKPVFSEKYTFYVNANDFVRLWVNDVKLIDAWDYSDSRELSATIDLKAGQYYKIKMEYADAGIYGEAKLYWSSAQQGKDIVSSTFLFNDYVSDYKVPSGLGLRGYYYNNSLHIIKKVDRIDNTIDFDWTSTTPDSSITNSSSFSVRWVGKIQPEFTNDYTFYLYHNDSASLWINNCLLIDKRRTQAYSDTEPSVATISLEAGKQYDIRLEYTNNSKSKVKLKWELYDYTLDYREYIPSNSYSIWGDKIRVDGFASEVEVVQPDLLYSGTVSIKLQDSNDGSVWTDVRSVPYGTGKIRYEGTKKYIRTVANVTNTNKNDKAVFGVAVTRTQIVPRNCLYPATGEATLFGSPEGLTFTTKTDKAISLKWSANNSNYSGYEVFRNAMKVATVTDCKYTDIDLKPNTEYTYTVRAIDNSYNLSNHSQALFVTTNAAPVFTQRTVKVARVLYKMDSDGNGYVDSTVDELNDKSYAEIEEIVEARSQNLKTCLEEASKYQGYKNSEAQPSVIYELDKSRDKIGLNGQIPTSEDGSIDYKQIMEDINYEYLLNQGVTDIWLFGYDKDGFEWFESNMASKHGSITNGCVHDGLPEVEGKTYVVFGLNLTRDTGTDLENYTHHFESVLANIDNAKLFNNVFVGDNAKEPSRCGWTHCPPNARFEYQFYGRNMRYVSSDIGNWNPDGYGKINQVNEGLWANYYSKLSLKSIYNNYKGKYETTVGPDSYWKIYWLQNIPGFDNGLIYNGKTLTNWWDIVTNLQESLDNDTTLLN